jgi:hypothetical protein
MRIATFNINGITARLPALLAWLDRTAAPTQTSRDRAGGGRRRWLSWLTTGIQLARQSAPVAAKAAPHRSAAAPRLLRADEVQRPLGVNHVEPPALARGPPAGPRQFRPLNRFRIGDLRTLWAPDADTGVERIIERAMMRLVAFQRVGARCENGRDVFSVTHNVASRQV